MIDWRVLLVALGIAWFVQCLSGWLQLRRYGTTLRELARRPDGWLATGSARGRFGQRAIAILVVGQDGIVERVMATSCWCSLATFGSRTQEQGRLVSNLAATKATDLTERAVVDAARRACDLRAGKHGDSTSLLPACV